MAMARVGSRTPIFSKKITIVLRLIAHSDEQLVYDRNGPQRTLEPTLTYLAGSTGGKKEDS